MTKGLARAIGFVAAALTGLTGCSHGDGAAPGLKDAAPVLAQFAEAGKALQGLGAAVAEDSDDHAVPASFRDQLRSLGQSAYAVLQKAEPTGPSGAAAIQRELATVASDVVRHLVTAEHAVEDGPNKLLSAPPGQVGFTINVPARPVGTDRSERGKNTARMDLKGAISREIEHLVYTALLVDPSARARFCGPCSQTDLPASVDPALHMPFDTTTEWRNMLFDEAGHLVVPSANDDRWVAFEGWTHAVNPKLRDAVYPLRQAAFDTFYL